VTEILDTNLPEPVVAPDTTTLSGLAETSESTTTYQEPATISTDNGVVELPQNAVNADGDHAVSTGANPVADGTGETIIYGDINTGGIQGETVVYEPPSMTVTGDGAAPAPAPVYTDTTYVEPVYTEPTSTEPIYTGTTSTSTSYSDPTLSETTTTNISMEDGNGRAIG
jgi:hypothetical protein